MSGGERPIGAARGKQPDTEALCQPPPPPPPLGPPPNSRKKRNLPLGKSCRAIFGTHTFGSHAPPPLLILGCPALPAWP